MSENDDVSKEPLNVEKARARHYTSIWLVWVIFPLTNFQLSSGMAKERFGGGPEGLHESVRSVLLADAVVQRFTPYFLYGKALLWIFLNCRK